VDDAEVIATISAGDLDGLAAVLNRYAERLYGYCHPLAPEDAAQAVEDTFIVAWTKLDELRDPCKLYPWLQAVASNECFRRRLARGLTGSPDSVPSILWMPSELPGRVLSACADNTPVGRARRVSATHRAGPFGFDGFPKAGPRPGTPRKRLRHPLAIASMTGVAAAVTAAAVAAGIGLGPAGASHHVRAVGLSPHAPVRPIQIGAASGAELPTTPATRIPSAASRARANNSSTQTPAGPPSVAAGRTAAVLAAPPPPGIGAAAGHHGKALGALRQRGNSGKR
jgi:hypothetical protein